MESAVIITGKSSERIVPVCWPTECLPEHWTRGNNEPWSETKLTLFFLYFCILYFFLFFYYYLSPFLFIFCTHVVPGDPWWKFKIRQSQRIQGRPRLSEFVQTRHYDGGVTGMRENRLWYDEKRIVYLRIIIFEATNAETNILSSYVVCMYIKYSNICTQNTIFFVLFCLFE